MQRDEGRPAHVPAYHQEGDANGDRTASRDRASPAGGRASPAGGRALASTRPRTTSAPPRTTPRVSTPRPPSRPTTHRAMPLMPPSTPRRLPRPTSPMRPPRRKPCETSGAGPGPIPAGAWSPSSTASVSPPRVGVTAAAMSCPHKAPLGRRPQLFPPPRRAVRRATATPSRSSQSSHRRRTAAKTSKDDTAFPYPLLTRHLAIPVSSVAPRVPPPRTGSGPATGDNPRATSLLSPGQTDAHERIDLPHQRTG